MQQLDFEEALFFFLAGSGKEQEREISLYSTLINISIIFVVLLSDDTKVYTLADRTA